MTDVAGERTMRVEHVPRCPVCGGDGPVVHGALEDRLFGAPGTWSMRRCDGCAGLWLDPRPTLDDLRLAYDTYYTHADGDAPTPPAGGLVASLKRVVRHLPGRRDDEAGALGYLTDPVGRVLDVGCGDGVNARELERRGWRVTAIDIDPASIEAAQLAGCADARVATIDSLDEPPGSYDAVVSIHSLEHVPDPAAVVHRARQLLRAGGRVSVVTPNSTSRLARRHGASWRGLEPPRHLQVFSPEALRRLLVAAGFVDVDVRTTARGTKGMVMAREHAAGRDRGPGGAVRAHVLGEVVQLTEGIDLRRHPLAGEELVGQGTAP